MLLKKKVIQIFSDGSLNFNYIFVKKRLKKLKIWDKDHINCKLNSKNLNSSLNSKELSNFKTKYF